MWLNVFTKAVKHIVVGYLLLKMFISGFFENDSVRLFKKSTVYLTCILFKLNLAIAIPAWEYF